MPYQIIHTPVPPDLQRAVDDLSEGVATGQITGLGIVVLTRKRRFFVDAFGTLSSDPHAGRGYVASLDDCLREIARQRHDTLTTV